MTSPHQHALRDELASVRPLLAPAIAAQLGASVRLAGGLHVRDHGTALEITVDRLTVARRLVADIGFLYGYAAQIEPGRGEHRHVVKVVDHPIALARRSGLIDIRGRFVRGMAVKFVQGSVTDAAALLRGAFAVRGELSRPARGLATIPCPTAEVALALVGAARRAGIAAKAPTVGAGEHDRLVVRGVHDIRELLTAMGATGCRGWWDTEVARMPARDHDLGNFVTSNGQRSARAARVTAARVERALEILRDATPTELRHAGQLRVDHPESSLDQLGRLSTPPLTKDAVAGRIRRLLELADGVAARQGVPTTLQNATRRP